MADDLYATAEVAIRQAQAVLAGGAPGDRDAAAYRTACARTIGVAIDKAQLLTGHPTSRREVTRQFAERRELLVRVLANPEAREYVAQLPGVLARFVPTLPAGGRRGRPQPRA